MSETELEHEALLFPVRKAWWYIPRRTLGSSAKASQGDAYFTAPNPPFGAVFTYYLREELRTREQARREREKEIEKEGGDTPYPGWEALRLEEIEEDPAIVLTVRDEAGEVVRRLSGPVEAGFHRVAWDLTYPPDVPRDAGDETERRRASGFLAPPGRYTVGLAKRVDGAFTELGPPRAFEVVPLHDGVTLAGSGPERMVAFTRRVSEMRRQLRGAGSAIDETKAALAAIREALMRSTVGDTSLDEETRALERRLLELELRLEGDPRRAGRGEHGPVSVVRRLEVAVAGNRVSTYGPTPTHVRSLEIAEAEFGELRAELARLIETDLPDLERRLEAARVPWTPGRGVPGE